MIDLVRTAYAAPSGIDLKKYFTPAKYYTSVSALVNVLLPNLFLLAGVVAFIFVIASGVQIILHSGGESKELEKDKQAFTAAVIGLIIIFGAYTIIQILEFVLGYKLLDPKL